MNTRLFMSHIILSHTQYNCNWFPSMHAVRCHSDQSDVDRSLLFYFSCVVLFCFMTIKRILDVPWSLPCVYHLIFLCVLSEVGQPRFARRWCILRAPRARRALFFTMWNETFGVRFLIHSKMWILHYVLIYLFKEIVNPLKVQYSSFGIWVLYLSKNALFFQIHKQNLIQINAQREIRTWCFRKYTVCGLAWTLVIIFKKVQFAK